MNDKILKHKLLLILLIILILAFILRIWVFSMTVNQPVWWDEADYLTLAKKIGTDSYPNFKLSELSNPRRPLLLPIIWGIIFKFGFGETTIRLTQFLFSMFAVFLTYLVGKEMFNKKIGLLSAFFMSVFWLNLFFTGRLLLGLPATVFWLACVYFFWKGYVKKENKKYIWLAGLFFGLSVFTRAASLIMFVPLIIFILMKDKIKFLKNKNLWIAGILFLLIFSPFLIWVGANYGNPFKKFTGIGEGRFSQLSWDTLIEGNTIKFIQFFPTYLQIPFLIVFLIGLVYFLDIFLGLDLLFKKEGSKLRNKIFLLMWIIVPLLFFGITTSQGNMEPRYLIYIFPSIFIIISVGLLKIYSYTKKYDKRLALGVILVILLIGCCYQITHASNIISIKKTSYLPVKESALWVKDNTKPNEVFMTQSFPQSMYYSERECYGYDNEEISKRQLKDLKPKYMIVSIFELHPEWVYKYPEKNNLKPVKVYPLGDKPALIIYEIPQQA